MKVLSRDWWERWMALDNGESEGKRQTAINIITGGNRGLCVYLKMIFRLS